MDDFEKIPYVVYESAQTRSERIIKKLIVALIIVTAMMFITNIVWIYEWTSYDYYDETGEEITLDGGINGNANYIGNDGEITNNGNDSGPVLPEKGSE